MAQDRTERYRIEIDVTQVIQGAGEIKRAYDEWKRTTAEALDANEKGLKNAADLTKKAEEAEKNFIKVIRSKTALINAVEKLNKAIDRDAEKRAKENEKRAKEVLDGQAAQKKALEDEVQARHDADEADKKAFDERAKRAQDERKFKQKVVDDEVKAQDARNAARQREAAARTRVQEQNGRQILRQIKANSALRSEVGRLVKAEGTLTARFDEQGRAANRDAAKLLRLADAHEDVRKEIERITRQGTGGAVLRFTPADIPNVLERAGLSPFQLRQAGFALERLGVPLAAALSQLTGVFDGIGIVTGGLIAGLAVVTLGVVGLTKAFIALGKAGVEALSALLKSSVELGTKFESVEKSFIGVFQGNEKAALFTIKRIREESIRLGVDLEEIVRKALPLVSSVEEAIGLGELAVGLAQLDPKLGEQGAVRAIQAGLVGNLEPLRKSFDVDVGPIVEAQARLGDVQGLLVGLREVLEARGLDFATLGDSMAVQVASMTQRWEDFRIVVGRPLVDSLSSALQELGEIAEENSDGIEQVANAIGLAASAVAEFLGEFAVGTLDQFDEEDFARISESILQIGASLRATVNILTGDDFRTVKDILVGVSDQFERIAKNTAAMTVLINASGQAALQLGTALLMGGPDRMFAQMTPAVGAFARSVLAGNKIIEESERVLDDLNQEQDEFRAGQQESTRVTEAQANAALALINATNELSAAESTLAEETEKVNERRGKMIRDFAFNQQQAVVKHNQRMAELELKFNQRRIDDERKHTQRMFDIGEKARIDAENADITADRKEEDLELKHDRKLIDLDVKNSEKRIDIFEDFRDKLEKIRRKFDFQAEEAIRDNDAVALARIRRRMAFELEEARLARDEDLKEQEEANEKEREQAQVAADRAREDAEIAERRKTEDLAKALKERRDAELLNIARIREETRIEEARQIDALRKDLIDQLNAMREALQHRLRELEMTLDDEIEAVRVATEQKVQIELAGIRRVAEARAAEAGRRYIRRSPDAADAAPGGGGVPLSSPGAPSTTGPSSNQPYFIFDENGNRIVNPVFRARGGPIFTGQPVVVGDPDPSRPNQPNPELIIPSTNGMVLPLNRMMFSPPNFGGGASNTFNNQRSVSADINMVDVNRLSPAAERRVRNIVTEVMAEALGG